MFDDTMYIDRYVPVLFFFFFFFWVGVDVDNYCYDIVKIELTRMKDNTTVLFLWNKENILYWL